MDANLYVRGFSGRHSHFSRFDICWRYADVLNNFTICLTLMFLPSGNSWRVMVAFAGFCFLIWALDRYILLYCSVQTPYATPVAEDRLRDTFSFNLALHRGCDMRVVRAASRGVCSVCCPE